MNLAEAAKQITKESGHYTGGAIQLFERVGRDSFVTLIQHGLLPQHTLLDFGAGCLRLGYWFVRFLDMGKYYAIEPSAAMLDAGKKYLLGAEVLTYKSPDFLVSAKCDMTNFGVPFN